MIILLFFAVMLFIASAASVYENDLMIRFYVTVRSRIATKLVLGRLPFLGGKNPPENRQRFTVIGIVFYTVSLLCIAFCIYTALTLEPVEGLEYGLFNTWGTGDKYNSTEYLIFRMAGSWLFFEVAVYLINSIGVILSRPNATRGKIFAGIFFLLLVLLFLGMGVMSLHIIRDTWRDIQAARG